MEIDLFVVKEKNTLFSVLERLNKLDSQIMFVVNESDVLVGTLTDGDIRRGFLRGFVVQDSIEKFMFKEFNYLTEDNLDFIKLKEYRIKQLKSVPVVDSQGKIVKVIDFSITKSILPVDAIIMAGGKGTRLKPLTDETPKPLLKIDGKEIISYNFDRLKSFGITNQNITVNYKSEQIVEFCKNYDDQINFKLFKEDNFLGTAGSISLIEEFNNDSILLMNSDLLTNIDYENFFLEFVRQEADILVASVPYEVSIPFGIFTCDDKDVKSIQEKPTKTFYANSGIYLIKKDVLKYIPKGKFFNATDLMEKVLNENKKLIHYPISEYWLDIGRMNDFQKAKNDIHRIKF